MKPDRTNYEIWLVDYLDGNLDGVQQGELFSFLNENPDLMEEVEGMSAIPLPSTEVSFRNKNSLKKEAYELTDTQFDLLCAASLENDLRAEQKSELDQAISADAERRKTSDLFLKTKLVPPQYTFRYKNRLKRLTPVQKVIRISAIGLSAAATVLIMFTILRNPVVDNVEMATGNRQVLKSAGDQDKRDERTDLQAATAVPEKKEAVKVRAAGSLIEKINETVSAEMRLLSENKAVGDTSLPGAEIRENNIFKIGGLTEVPQENVSPEISLVTMNLTPVDPFNDEEGNAVGNFFAKIVREKILKSKTPEKGNLKAYEVADAGLTGINKLFGSNMTLKRSTDEKGEVKSVYFNSKILKFNAPLKKAEPLE
jgi:hypothetical protein